MLGCILLLRREEKAVKGLEMMEQTECKSSRVSKVRQKLLRVKLLVDKQIKRITCNV